MKNIRVLAVGSDGSKLGVLRIFKLEQAKEAIKFAQEWTRWGAARETSKVLVYENGKPVQFLKGYKKFKEK